MGCGGGILADGKLPLSRSLEEAAGVWLQLSRFIHLLSSTLFERTLLVWEMVALAPSIRSKRFSSSRLCPTAPHSPGHSLQRSLLSADDKPYSKEALWVSRD